MKLSINGLEIGEGTSYYLSPGLEGFGKPPIRTSGDDYSGLDGGYVSDQYYGRRELVIPGFYNAGSCDEAQQLRNDLEAALEIRADLPLIVTTFNGDFYYANVRVVDLKAPITSGKSGVFQIYLMASDPYFYDGGDGIDPDSGFQTATVYRYVGGGYLTPYILPVEWEPGSTPTVVENTGDLLIYPQLVLPGTFTNPVITNRTTGQFVGLDLTTTAGDEVVIDMKEHTVTLNGGNIASLRTDQSSWWPLLAGDNEIVLETAGGGDDDEITIRWRAAYGGI